MAINYAQNILGNSIVSLSDSDYFRQLQQMQELQAGRYRQAEALRQIASVPEVRTKNIDPTPNPVILLLEDV